MIITEKVANEWLEEQMKDAAKIVNSYQAWNNMKEAEYVAAKTIIEEGSRIILNSRYNVILCQGLPMKVGKVGEDKIVRS